MKAGWRGKKKGGQKRAMRERERDENFANDRLLGIEPRLIQQETETIASCHHFVLMIANHNCPSLTLFCQKI